MDVRIGLTQTPKELEIQLARRRRSPPPSGHRSTPRWRRAAPCGSPTARVARSAWPRPRSWPTSRSAARTTSGASASAADREAAGGPTMTVDLLDRKLLFVTGKGGVGKTTIAASLALLAAQQGKRTLVGEVDAKGNLADFFEIGADLVQGAGGVTGALRDVDGHRGVAQGVPEPPAEDPSRRADRPAGPHVRLRGQRRTGGQGDPHGRQVPVGGARARSYDLVVVDAVATGPHHRPARRAPGHPGARAGRAWSATRRGGCSTSSATRRRPASSSWPRPRRCRSTRRSSWPTRLPVGDGRRPGGRGRQPRAPGAVRPGEEEVFDAARRTRRRGRARARPWAAPVRPHPRRRAAGGHAAAHPRRAPGPPAGGAARRARRCSTCPTSSSAATAPGPRARSPSTSARSWGTDGAAARSRQRVDRARSSSCSPPRRS